MVGALPGRRPIDLRVVVGVIAAFVGLELLTLRIEDAYAPVIAPVVGFTALVYLYPFFKDRPLDAFAPPVYTSLPSLLMLASTVAYWLSSGSLELDWLELLSAEERSWLILETLFALSLSQMAYYVGFYTLRMGGRLSRYLPDVAAETWRPLRLFTISFVVFAGSAVGYYFFQRELGVGIGDTSAIGMGRDVINRSNPQSSWMARTIVAAFIPLYFYLAHVASSRRLFKLALFGLPLVVVMFLISRTGGRGLFMAPFLACVIIYHYVAKRVPASMVLALWLGAMAFSNVFGQYRLQVRTGQETAQTVQEDDSGGFVESLAGFARERKHFFTYSLLLYEFPRNHDHLLGETYAGVLVALIPRWIWPNKLDFAEWHESDVVRKLRGAPFPTPFMGLMYINFSYVGIVVGFLLWGVFHRSLYEWLLRSNGDRGTTVLYAMFLLFFGPSLAGISGALQYIIPVFLTLKVIRYQRAARMTPQGA